MVGTCTAGVGPCPCRGGRGRGDAHWAWGCVKCRVPCPAVLSPCWPGPCYLGPLGDVLSPISRDLSARRARGSRVAREGGAAWAWGDVVARSSGWSWGQAVGGESVT